MLIDWLILLNITWCNNIFYTLIYSSKLDLLIVQLLRINNHLHILYSCLLYHNLIFLFYLSFSFGFILFRIPLNLNSNHFSWRFITCLTCLLTIICCLLTVMCCFLRPLLPKITYLLWPFLFNLSPYRLIPTFLMRTCYHLNL